MATPFQQGPLLPCAPEILALSRPPTLPDTGLASLTRGLLAARGRGAGMIGCGAALAGTFEKRGSLRVGGTGGFVLAVPVRFALVAASL